MSWYEKLNAKIDHKAFQFTVFTTIAILIGGLVEIPPFFIQDPVQPMADLQPYDPLELTGRDVYMAEGCHYCHTQLVRPFKWETDRWDPNRDYGVDSYSKAGEFVYDHPFLWGSKRTGPDLAHEASINNNWAWQRQHLIDPRSVREGSIMPSYAYLFEDAIDVDTVKDRMYTLRKIGVPYKIEDIETAKFQLEGMTKGDALVAYLLKLGKDTKRSKK